MITNEKIPFGLIEINNTLSFLNKAIDDLLFCQREYFWIYASLTLQDNRRKDIANKIMYIANKINGLTFTIEIKELQKQLDLIRNEVIKELTNLETLRKVLRN